MENIIFSYNNSSIPFIKKDECIFISATQMAKPFGKNPKDYLRLQSTKEFVNAISARQMCLPTDIVRVINGGNNFGTWMHEDIALDFAQWLSIDFKLWVNDRIKELMKFGFTATPQTLENIVNNPDLLIKLGEALKSEREQKEQLQA
jgi:prophage antirepressor-like protein